jgi:hypothetical protein
VGCNDRYFLELSNATSKFNDFQVYGRDAVAAGNSSLINKGNASPASQALTTNNRLKNGVLRETG